MRSTQVEGDTATSYDRMKGKVQEELERHLKPEFLNRVDDIIVFPQRLIEIGFDPALGARPMRRAMQHEVEDGLSERILHGQLEAGDHITVDAASGEFVFENAPRGEKVAIGMVSTPEISTNPRSRRQRVGRHAASDGERMVQHPLSVNSFRPPAGPLQRESSLMFSP